MAAGTETPSPPERGRPGIRNTRDFWGSVALGLIALVVLWAARDLPGRQGHIFGPGTTPRLLAICLLVLAVGVALSSLFGRIENIGRFQLRGPFCVTLAIVAFAAAIRPLGLALTTFGCFLIASAASKDTRRIETLLTAAGFTAGAVLLFRYGLSLPFEVWPSF
jgi:putative tricarboxylic transport membrane protein